MVDLTMTVLNPFSMNNFFYRATVCRTDIPVSDNEAYELSKFTEEETYYEYDIFIVTIL